MQRVEGMRPVHWSSEREAPGDARARAELRKRFTGLDEQIARAVGQMADFELEREKRPPAPWRVFCDIRPQVPAGLRIAVSWTVHVVAHGPAIRALDPSGEVRMPVIPDENNPRPGGVIEPGDRPFEFPSMQAAERAAEQATAAMHANLSQLLRSQP